MPLQATLEEVVEADILIHVMDGSSAQMLQQRQAVLSILQQLGKFQFSCHCIYACGVCLQSLIVPAPLSWVCKDSKGGSQGKDSEEVQSCSPITSPSACSQQFDQECLREILLLLADISEERLQTQMIEVVNKADLLAEFLGSADQDCLEQEPAASGAGAESASCHTRGAERHLYEEEGRPAVAQDMRMREICDEASRAESLSTGAADSEVEDFQERTASQAPLAHSSTSVHLPVICGSSKGGSAAPLSWCYDGQPRDINTNIEWLREQQTRCSGPPTVLTSALTGQGLHDLMQEVEHMLRNRQGRTDAAEQVSPPGSQQKHGSLQTQKSPDKEEQTQRIPADNAHARELVSRAA